MNSSRLLLVFLCMAGVVSSAQAVELDDLRGVWKMQGYGTVYDVGVDKVTTYDVTDVSCQATYVEPFDVMAKEWTHIEASGTGYSFVEAGGITRYAIDRLPELPSHCRPHGAPPNNDPLLNFSVLWHAFAENYAFFDLHKVDWHAQFLEQRRRLASAPSETALFDAFSQMLKSLNDSHVYLRASGRTIHSGHVSELKAVWSRDGGSLTDEASYKIAIRRHITRDILRGRFTDAADQALTWGWAAPGVGYLQVDNMLKGDVSLPERLRRIDEGMERALKDLASARALIVDARFNGGGRDAVSLRIAGYFTEQRRLAFTKKAVLPAGYTEPQPIYIEPNGRHSFRKPIFYLQSGNTVSAAEIFTLAMMALPNATRIGTPTYGVLSDTLPKTLPNGWVVTLSNEVYVAADGVCYESVGIPPQVRIETSTEDSFSQRLKRDIAVALREAGR